MGRRGLAPRRGQCTAAAAANLHWACLSRLPGKRARPVLRGPRRGDASGLPDWRASITCWSPRGRLCLQRIDTFHQALGPRCYSTNMGQPRGHRCQPDLSHSPSPAQPSTPSITTAYSTSPRRSKPSSSHLHTPPTSRSAPTHGGSRPLALPSATTARTGSAAMPARSTKAAARRPPVG